MWLFAGDCCAAASDLFFRMVTLRANRVRMMLRGKVVMVTRKQVMGTSRAMMVT